MCINNVFHSLLDKFKPFWLTVRPDYLMVAIFQPSKSAGDISGLPLFCCSIVLALLVLSLIQVPFGGPILQHFGGGGLVKLKGDNIVCKSM